MNLTEVLSSTVNPQGFSNHEFNRNLKPQEFEAFLQLCFSNYEFNGAQSFNAAVFEAYGLW